mgnify:CR=1 FL=1
MNMNEFIQLNGQSHLWKHKDALTTIVGQRIATALIVKYGNEEVWKIADKLESVNDLLGDIAFDLDEI